MQSLYVIFLFYWVLGSLFACQEISSGNVVRWPKVIVALLLTTVREIESPFGIVGRCGGSGVLCSCEGGGEE